MPPYNYWNSIGNNVSTPGNINMILKKGPMSFCRAVDIADQHGCKYREDASSAERCMYYRDGFDGACDCIWAQRGIDKPKVGEAAAVDDEVEQAMTIIPT